MIDSLRRLSWTDGRRDASRSTVDLLDPLRLFFSFRGRVTRAGFWLVTLTWAVIANVIEFAWIDTGAAAAWIAQERRIAVAVVALLLVPFVSLVAVGARRLHDRDKSAWWLVVFYAAPLLMRTAAQLNDLDAAVMVWLMAGSGVLTIWGIIELGCRPGSARENRFGPNPLLADAWQSA